MGTTGKITKNGKGVISVEYFCSDDNISLRQGAPSSDFHIWAKVQYLDSSARRAKIAGYC